MVTMGLKSKRSIYSIVNIIIISPNFNINRYWEVITIGLTPFCESIGKAAEYLALCSGYPKNVKVKLYRTNRKFDDRKGCHEITFTMYVTQPALVSMEAPIHEDPGWNMIRQANHEVRLIEEGKAIRLFQTDFNRFV